MRIMKMTCRPILLACIGVMLWLLTLPPELHASPPSPGGETNTILQSWSFQDTNNWSNDGGYLPLSYTNLDVSDLGDGTAVVVDATNYAWLRYNVVETNGTNLTVNHGTVAFWFAPTWAGTNQGGTGPGDWGRLIEVGTYTTNASYGWWSLYFDPAGTHLYFSSQTNNGMQDTYLSAPISCKTNFWHFLALTYDATNCALYLDGQLVTNGLALSFWPGTNVLTNGFTIGSDGSGTIQAHGMFDDLVTFSYPLDASTISGMFLNGVVYFLLNPANAANLTQAPSQPVTTPTFEAITGSGFLTPIATNTSCLTSSNVWLTNLSAAFTNNGTMNLTFTIAGGSNGCVYDVFATPALEYPLTNGQWYWMGQGAHCVTYTITNLPAYSAMFILGTPQDSDGDGLTDAYELLVSHTDPHDPDTLGLGISDGWQVAYGYYGADPFSEPFNNGWTLLDEFLNGLDPTVYNQPPAPQGLTASFVKSTATVSWNPSSGAVTGYKLEKYDPAVYPATTNDFLLSASADQYVDAGQELPDDDLEDGPPIYRLQAIYGTHNSAWSAWVPLYSPDPVQFWGSGYLAHGPQGQIFVTIPAPPQQAQSVRIVFANAWPSNQTWIVPLSSFTNNAYLLPPATVPEFVTAGNWFAELRDAATNLLGTVKLVYYGYEYYPFYDGRQQLQQNLSFLLRAAGATSPFEFTLNDGSTVVYSCPADHAVASFVELFYDDPGYITPTLDVFTPFRNDYFLRNFAFTTNDLNANGTLDSVSGYTAGVGPEIVYPPVYNFPGPTNGTHIDPILAPTDFPWTFFQSAYTTDSTFLSGADIGYGAGGFALPSSGVNLFGLAFQSVQMAYETNGTLDPELVSRPATVPDYGNNVFYPSTAAPVLATTNYYFGVPFTDPLPGDGVFALTNSTPTLIAGIGQPYWLAGYAKQAIINGDSSKFGFLGQYFAGAYLIDTNGVVTTNQTGILSEYGEFFPTQPGPTALVTMTNWGENASGAAVVNVIALCVDANHDGTIDTTYWGPDATSFLSPFRFWINDDHDEPASASNPDRDLNDWGTPPLVPPDYAYGAIRCQRNLEDFARLWICGVPTLTTNENYSLRLAWTDIRAGAPRMRLYWASETNGGTRYLTDTNIAAQQIAENNSPIGEVSPTNTLTLPANAFRDGVNKCFLFEAGAAGSGQLTLTIIRGGTNDIAQTSAWFDFHNITDFYEQALVTNVLQDWPSMVETNLASGFTVLSYAKLNPGDTKQLAVFVHGWRMGVWDWYNFSETMFKRLWWQGYQGQFAALRWPTRNANTELFPQMGYITYNRSEHIAFKSGTGAAAYLNDLRNRFPDYTISGCAHSMGGIVMMESLKELVGTGQQPVDNCVLMQAAVPAQCFDTNAPSFQMFTNTENVVPTPDIYRDYARGITNALRPGGKIANFFNPDDFALWTWQLNQAFYVANLLGNGVTTMKPNAFFGYSTDGTNSTLSTNVWNQSFYAIIYGGYYGNEPTRAVTDPLELMPFVARPRSLAVGAQPNVYGQIQGQQLDLENQLGFGAEISDHSGEFNRNIQEPPIWPFYSELRTNLFPQQ
ncbi:MAG TPA: LamG-like jellyroll fold domain-containing protein [Verrucomicrobiae bacterium]|nr:LamG-like jellyroll fold domain-containing protein [Verrucomicrobiae bacterium]